MGTEGRRLVVADDASSGAAAPRRVEELEAGRKPFSTVAGLCHVGDRSEHYSRERPAGREGTRGRGAQGGMPCADNPNGRDRTDSPPGERLFYAEAVRLEDVDGIRRSLAIGGTLTRADAERLLDACQALLEQLGPRSAKRAPLSTSCPHRARVLTPRMILRGRCRRTSIHSRLMSPVGTPLARRASRTERYGISLEPPDAQSSSPD
jgi:hypothetical protein